MLSSPVWLRWAYRFLILTCVCLGAFVAFAKVNEYASGPAVLRKDGDAGFKFVAALPGRYLPALKSGMAVRLELEGLHNSYQTLTIDTFEPKAVSSAEAKAALGLDFAQTQPSWVVVQGQVAGATQPLFEGMHGKAQAKVRTSRLLTLIVPWTRASEGAR